MQYLLFALVVYFTLCNSQQTPQSSQSTFQYTRLNITNTAILLVDHQSGLANGILDQNQLEFRNNLMALAKIAKLFQIPVVVSTSNQDGPNGPYLESILNELPDNTVIIPRPGEINAWDNNDFKSAVEATDATKLIVSGIVTEVCVSFVALSLKQEGYDVYVALDSSGTYSSLASTAGKDRMLQAGIIPMTWFAIACEFQSDWRNTDTVDGFTDILREHLPWYANVMESWNFLSGSQQPNQPTQPSSQPTPRVPQPTPRVPQPTPRVPQPGPVIDDNDNDNNNDQ
jgi:nicotinamidase-related amidase